MGSVGVVGPFLRNRLHEQKRSESQAKCTSQESPFCFLPP